MTFATTRFRAHTLNYLFPLPLLAFLSAIMLCLVSLTASAQTIKKPAQVTSIRPTKTIKKNLNKEIKSMRFCIYGDTRDGHEMHRKIIALMAKQDPEFVIQTGDLVHTGSKTAQWKIYDEVTAPLRNKVPFYISRGNHDSGGPLYEAHVTAPFTSGNKLYYSFDRGNAHFIALCIDHETPFGSDSAQYKWLVTDLEKTVQTKPAHTFVFFHVAPYSIGYHGSDLEVRKTLCPLFIKYGVRAVFTGHDHNYYHTTRDKVTYIVTGGGGAELYPTDAGKGVIEGDKYESVNHCLVCEITGNIVAFTVLRADGTTLDRFSLHAK